MRKTDWLFVAMIASLLWMYGSAMALVASVLGHHLSSDLFWYGLSTMLSGVAFKTIWDQF